MVFNATFNNISVITCRSVLLVEEMIICVLYMRIEMHILSLGWEENECIVYYRKSLTNFIT